MHAGFPQFIPDLTRVMRVGAGADADLRPLLSQTGGRLLGESMALLLRLGFGFVMRDSLLDEQQSAKASAFFDKHFVLIDPGAPGGKRWYQGKFLIRTRRPRDDMNVYLRFCPDPDKLFRRMPWGRALNPLAVVDSEALDEERAQRLEDDPDKVDLVIRFKDAESILGLIGRPNVDIVGLLLQNVVQLTGNVGHLFKLGAIGSGVQAMLGVETPASH
jgi:hypothetical protein